ncbi:inter-alpha trypsin inhibitor, heavy chain 1, isoform CRA_b [Mus musculus]|nr:inter-alpha trypsin inhibitor, heavy chain 1, isoform CRA_b [Mus musculus]
MEGATGLRVLLCLLPLLTLQARPALGLATGRPRGSEKRHAVDTSVNGVSIKSLKVNCKVTSRFAHYVITSQVVNNADKAREVAFDVEIPKTAFISDFAITSDGKAFIGDIKDKVTAWKQYRKAAPWATREHILREIGNLKSHIRLSAGSDSSEHYTEPQLQRVHVLLEGPGCAAEGWGSGDNQQEEEPGGVCG